MIRKTLYIILLLGVAILNCGGEKKEKTTGPVENKDHVIKTDPVINKNIGIKAKTSARTTIIVTKIGKKKSAVKFNHEYHSKIDGVPCKFCHHEGRQNDPCAKCHKGKKGKVAIHKNCIGCHKKMKKGPVKCSLCHKK